jgi:hypothetical protein
MWGNLTLEALAEAVSAGASGTVSVTAVDMQDPLTGQRRERGRCGAARGGTALRVASYRSLTRSRRRRELRSCR